MSLSLFCQLSGVDLRGCVIQLGSEQEGGRGGQGEEVSDARARAVGLEQG